MRAAGALVGGFRFSLLGSFALLSDLVDRLVDLTLEPVNEVGKDRHGVSTGLSQRVFDDVRDCRLVRRLNPAHHSAHHVLKKFLCVDRVLIIFFCSFLDWLGSGGLWCKGLQMIHV